jgi:thiamine kinase-like enzyme
MRIGEATNPAELAVEAAIAKIAPWRGKDVSYERINGGITNLNWKVRLAEQGAVYFMKIPGAKTDVFIDRKAAYEAAIKVAATGHAPKLIHYIEEDEIEVHEFLETFRSCNVSDLLDATIRANVVRAYRDIHATQSFSLRKTGYEQLAERLAQVKAYGGHLPRDLDYLSWQCRRAEQAVGASGVSLCACNNDGYVANYMVDAGKNVKIIDWEYGSNNDPYWDLAMLSLENFFTRSTIREMLEIHDGASRSATEARVLLYMGVAAVTWALWAALQASISSLPFDFAKYSDLLFLRARQAMRAPIWEEALGAA